MAQQLAEGEEAPAPPLARRLVDMATQAVPETKAAKMQTHW